MREQIARALAAHDGHDPDETWEEYDRNSAASVTMNGEYPNWQADVFPKVVRWEEYLPQSDAILPLMEKVAQAAIDAGEAKLVGTNADLCRSAPAAYTKMIGAHRALSPKAIVEGVK